MVPGRMVGGQFVMATLSALVSGLEAELQRLGYKDSTLVWYRGCWRRMQMCFAAHGVEEFSLNAAMAWVDDACGFFGKEQAGTLKPTDYTDVNHSFAFGAGNVISTANDLAIWTKALVGGKVLDSEYQKLWLDSPQVQDPAKPGGQWYGYGITRQKWGSNNLIYHGGSVQTVPAVYLV